MKKIILPVIAAFFCLSAFGEGSSLYPSAMSSWNNHTMPSVGEVRIPFFYIEFQNAVYPDEVVQGEEINDYVFNSACRESVTNYYDRSSYGNLKLYGDVYLAQAEHNIEYYERDDGYELLAMELFGKFNDEEFCMYDADDDGYMDAFVICVPEAGDRSFWYGCKMSWYYYEDYTVGGLYPSNYVICDSQAIRDDMDYFYQTIYHELAHCMGLPDYYKYFAYNGDDEAMNGYAGFELMDEMSGDLSQFSKLQLGWLSEDQVKIFNGKEKETFEIDRAEKGGCIIIFPKRSEKYLNFQREYFVVEYNTPDGNLEGLFEESKSGVRILHVNAETMSEYGRMYYRYNNHSDEFDPSENGIRIIRRTDDKMGFYREGDKIVYGDHDFKWYNKSPCGKFEIDIDSLDGEKAVITVKPL